MPAVILAAPGPVFIDPNQQTVHSNATITANGGNVYSGFGVKELTLVINVKNAPTGTSPTLQFTVQEVDPGDQTTVFGPTKQSTVINAAGIQTVTFPFSLGGAIKVSWTVGGSSPSFTGVYVTVLSKAASTVVNYNSAGTEVGTASAPLRTDPTGTTVQPTSVASLPLPSGAATEATLATRLAEATFTARVNTLGQKTMANSSPVVLASDQSAVPVSGTVTANVGTTGGLALDATLTGGTQKAIARGGAKGATVAGDVTSTNVDANTQALDTSLKTSIPAGSNVIGALTANQTVNLSQVGGTATVTGGVAGSQGVGGLAANNAAVSGNPVLSGGSDGTNARSMLVDANGRQVVVGAAAEGAAVAGNPVLVGGDDGTNARSLLVDTSGRARVVGAAASGATLAGDPVLVGASDGTNAQTLQSRTTDILAGLQALLVRNIPAKKATFTAAAYGIAPANNKSMLAVFLAAGATNVLRLRKVFIRNTATSALTGVATIFELRRCTANTVGTAVTPVQLDTGDAALGANITVNTGGTVTDAAGAALDRWLFSSDEWGPGTLDQEGAEHSFQNHLPVWDVGADPERELTIRTAGSRGWHIKCATNTTAGVWDIIFVFTQE